MTPYDVYMAEIRYEDQKTAYLAKLAASDSYDDKAFYRAYLLTAAAAFGHPPVRHANGPYAISHSRPTKSKN